MQSPYVKSLEYEFRTSQYISYKNPNTIEFETDDFKGTLKNNAFKIEFKKRYDSIDNARIVAERFLKAWEIKTTLEKGKNEFSYDFRCGKIVEQPSGQDVATQLKGTIVAKATVNGVLTVERSIYPAPPTNFKITPDVISLYNRWIDYIEGREKILSMAYFCLTVIVNSAGVSKNRRKIAALKYKIDINVLNTLGKLSSEYGDLATARKISKKGTLKPLSTQEINWIETCIKMLIKRLAQLNSISTLQKITMENLPTI